MWNNITLGFHNTFLETHTTGDGVCTKLRPELLKVRLKGEIPKPTEVRKLFVKGCGEEYDENNRDFPFAFMEEVTSMRLDFSQPADLGYPTQSWVKYRGFEESQLEKIRKLLDALLTNQQFSLRHYAMKKRPTIRSNFALWNDGTIESATSPGKDWNYLGDTAFTFWWFSVNGKVPTNNRNFIESSGFYDEIELTEKNIKDRGLWNVEFFASTDLMKHADSLQNRPDKPVLLRGKLQNLPEIVFGYFLLTNKMATLPLDEFEKTAEATVTKILLNTITKAFPVFEVKIPGTVGKTSWKIKPKGDGKSK